MQQNDIGDGIVQDTSGDVIFKVKFRAISCIPEEGEVLDGEVFDVSNIYIQVQSGPIKCVINMNVSYIGLNLLLENERGVQIRPVVQPLDPKGRTNGPCAGKGRSHTLQDRKDQVPEQRLCKCDPSLNLCRVFWAPFRKTSWGSQSPPLDDEPS